MLEMLLKNLAENPMQPRYRKIAISNKNFERCLKKLDGHDQLLIACGLETDEILITAKQSPTIQ